MLARLFLPLVVLLAAALPAQAGRLVDVQIVNRSTGQVLNTYRHHGQAYVAGTPGDRYAVRLVNRSGGRVLVVLSVDGVNAVTGETASPDQSGYVLGPYGRAEISGWRKSLQEVAGFYFTALPDSYAARTGRPDNVGVIGVAAFREKVRKPEPWPESGAPSPLAAPTNRPDAPLPAPAPAMRPDASSAAPAAAAEAEAADGRKSLRQAERLGTGHGERVYAPVRHTEFERASTRANQTIVIRYDSRANLVAQGVIPRPRPRVPGPDPFPARFVPDPRG